MVRDMEYVIVQCTIDEMINFKKEIAWNWFFPLKRRREVTNV